MKKVITLIIPTIFLLALTFSAHAGPEKHGKLHRQPNAPPGPPAQQTLYGQPVPPTDFDDSRTFGANAYNPTHSSGGLKGNWRGFTISWNITEVDDLWTYEYTLSATRKAISHFILEVTNPSLSTGFINPQMKIGSEEWTSTTFEGPMVWSRNKQGNSNPNMPADIYGIKFNGGGTTVSYLFQTTQDPVWGNFYAKSGNDKGKWVYDYNNALGITNFNSNNKLDFIVRPDGGATPPAAPEPISSLLFVIGGTVYAAVYMWKNKKKT